MTEFMSRRSKGISIYNFLTGQRDFFHACLASGESDEREYLDSVSNFNSGKGSVCFYSTHLLVRRLHISNDIHRWDI